MDGISQLRVKLSALGQELGKMDIESVFFPGKEEYKHIMAKLEAWKLRKEEFKNEFYARLLSEFSVSYEALEALEIFINLNLDARFEKLAMKLSDPDDIIGEFMKNEDPDPEGVIEGIRESEVQKRALEKMVVMSKAIIGEIKEELKSSRRKTLAQFLQETQHATYFPFEWSNLNELRINIVQTGIELSLLLVHFLFFLAGKEEKFKCLKSKIESIINVSKNCMVAAKFLALAEMAEDTMSELKLKGDLMESIEEHEISTRLIKQFFEAIIDLDSIMSSLTVPETMGRVAGARIRLEGALCQILYDMQGIKLKINKQKTKYWKKMKVIIPELWKDMMSLLEKDEESGSSAKQDEEAGSSAKQDEEVGSSSKQGDEDGSAAGL